jgi:molecular chaperone GrpE
MGQADNHEVEPTDVSANPPPESSSGDPEPPASPDAEAQELRRKLEEKEAEARTCQDQFLRERAELENFKKRMQREKTEALRFANEPLIRELLPVIDNLERALAHADGDDQSVLEGIRLVLKSLLDVLARYGVQRIEAVGQPFDPTRHEAMSQVESSEHEPNHVMGEHHSGYLLHDRLLRPALVTVSTRKSDRPVETEPKSD